MIRNKLFSMITLLLVSTMSAMEIGQEPPTKKPKQLTEQEVENAGLFASIGVWKNTPLDVVCSYLPLRDIAHLRQTCRALSTTWNHEQPIAFTRDTIPYEFLDESKNQVVLVRGLEVKNSMTSDQKISSAFALLSGKLQECRNRLELDLGLSGLTELPETTKLLTTLEVLNLDSNNFNQETLARACDWLPNVEELNLDNNNLDEMPDAIQKLKKLKGLGVAGNYLSPEAIATIATLLPELEELNLSNNELDALPEAIKNLNKLKVLDIEGNNFSAVKIANICMWLPSLQWLSLCIDNSMQLPVEMQYLIQLRHLNIRVDGSITPEMIRNACLLPNLRELHLRYDTFEGLPTEIQNLTQLKVLDLFGDAPDEETQGMIRSWLPHAKIIIEG